MKIQTKTHERVPFSSIKLGSLLLIRKDEYCILARAGLINLETGERVGEVGPDQSVIVFPNAVLHLEP